MESENKVFLECTYSESQIPFERHFHNAYELIFICGGAVRFEIGEFCYNAGPNTVLFISKLEEHNLRILNGFYRRYYIILSSSQLNRLIEEPKLKSIFISRPAGFRHMFDLSQYSNEINTLFSSMVNEYEHPESFSRYALTNLFGLMTLLCYRACEDQFRLPSKKFCRAVYDIQKYIDGHFSEEINLNDLAARFYISPSYLSHAFREWTGISPKQYIMRSRLAYAKELLIKTDLPVAVIASRCGFNDVSNFIRSFRKEAYETPLQYRLYVKNSYC